MRRIIGTLRRKAGDFRFLSLRGHLPSPPPSAASLRRFAGEDPTLRSNATLILPGLRGTTRSVVAGACSRALLAILLAGCTGIAATLAVAGDTPPGLAATRDDLTPNDLARVIAITKPTTDFSKAEQFELM